MEPVITMTLMLTLTEDTSAASLEPGRTAHPAATVA
jgi:hypothetical protein